MTRIAKDKTVALLVLGFFMLFVGAFQAVPLFMVLRDSFFKDSLDGNGALTLYNYFNVFKSGFMRQSLLNSMELSLWSTVLGFVIAFQGAYSISRLGPKVREKALLLSNMTSNFSGLPLAFAFVVILGMHGVVTLLLRKMGLFESFDIYSRAGLVITYTYFQIPLGILLLYPSFDGIREEWKEAASLLGASSFCIWTCIILPVLAPAICGTAIILFANAMGAYATAYGLMATNYNIVPIRITSLVAGDIFLKPNLASALALVLTAILLTLVVVNELVLKRTRNWHEAK